MAKNSLSNNSTARLRTPKIRSFEPRWQLLLLLQRYHAITPNDQKQKTRIERFIKKNPSCLDRFYAPGHITGSAWVVDPTGTKVLLTHHKKLNRWLQLGGHADGDPDLLRVALREAREESSVRAMRLFSDGIFDVDVHRIPPHRKEAAHFHFDIRFALMCERPDNVKASRESHQLAWVDIDKLKSLTHERSLLRMAAKWKRMAHRIGRTG